MSEVVVTTCVCGAACGLGCWLCSRCYAVKEAGYALREVDTLQYLGMNDDEERCMRMIKYRLECIEKVLCGMEPWLTGQRAMKETS